MALTMVRNDIVRMNVDIIVNTANELPVVGTGCEYAIYQDAGLDKKVFSKIKNHPDYHPKKETALCLCIGAQLSLDESKDLLARAGYALSPCNLTDVIFQYFIENKIYDIFELDNQLEEYGVDSLLG